MKKGWQTKKLSELYKIGSSKRVLQSQWKTEGVPFYRGREVTRLAADGFVDNELFISEKHFAELSKEYGVPKAGDIVITAIGTIGNSHVVRSADRFYFKDASVLWMKRTAEVSSEFVNLWLKSPAFFDQLDRGNGATVDTLTIQKLQSVGIAVPPLAEQQRIVGLLDEAFEGLATAKANAEKNLQNARALFENLLTSAMSGKLTKEWRKSHPHVETGSALLDQILAKRRHASSKKGEYLEPTPPSTNDSPSIPASWTWTNLSQLKTFSLYGPRFSNDDYSQTGVLVLRTTDIDEHGKVNSDTAPKLKMTEEEFDKYRCKKGDLLITRTGSLGTLAVFDDDTRAIPGAYLIQFRLGFSEVIPWFLFAFFKSPAAQALLTSGGTGAGIQNLNVPTLEAIPIPFPPLDEQREIVFQLNTLAEETQSLARLYERKHAALEALKKSLLHQAFTGEL